jgi:hypothetical protein
MHHGVERTPIALRQLLERPLAKPSRRLTQVVGAPGEGLPGVRDAASSPVRELPDGPSAGSPSRSPEDRSRSTATAGRSCIRSCDRECSRSSEDLGYRTEPSWYPRLRADETEITPEIPRWLPSQSSKNHRCAAWRWTSPAWASHPPIPSLSLASLGRPVRRASAPGRREGAT